MTRKIGHILLAAALGVSVIKSIILFHSEPENYQWDSRVYYNAPLNWVEGGNPYKEVQFVYPPVWLPVLRVFSLTLSPEGFFNFYLAIKLLSLLVCIVLLKKLFPLFHWTTVFLAVWLGFYGSLYLDLRAGNIGIFETAIFLLALSAFVKKKWTQYAGWILFVGSLKLTPFLLLGLLLFVEDQRHARRAFILGCGGILLFVTCNFLFFGSFTQTFLTEALNRTQERGIVAPSVFALAGEIQDILSARFSILSPLPLAVGIYLCVAILISLVTLRTFRAQKDPLFIFCLGIITYSAVVPRMKDYAYGPLLPAFFLALPLISAKEGRLFGIFFFVITSTLQAIPPVANQLTIITWNYLPVFQAGLLWLFLVQHATNKTTLTQS